MISERTRYTLQAAKARGVSLGGRRESRAQAANERPTERRSVFETVSALSVRAAAEELTRRGVPASSGGRWHPTQVARVRRRLAD
jgi:DNA invertase Pin-like site-specific DNA recombinase